MKRVVIVQKSLTHYRVPFFEGLRRRCAELGIDVRLVYGDGTPAERSKGDLVEIPWAIRVPNRILATPWGHAIWQPVWPHLRGADLVVVEQAGKLLLNYALQVGRLVGQVKLAFWGHGRNYQGGSALVERVKRLLATQVDWWFAYNELSAAVVAGYGFPEERITDVRNAIDTRGLRRAHEAIGADEVAALRQQLELPHSNVCVYCGGLYADKRLDLLVQGADTIRERVDDFALVVIGDGPQRSVIEEAARERPWMRYLGPRFGREKAAVFRLAKLQLMPGLVGLGVLDSFAVGVPLVTTRLPIHSPEIAYLVPGENGAMTAPDVGAYADAVVALLQDDVRLDAMRRAAWAAADRYTIEGMVERYARGLEAALRS